jgi:glycosyltransferase involved in cell wall biosynthesis
MSISIHQFAPATAMGDGVTGGLFYTREMLRKLGYRSEIYAGTVPPGLSDEIHLSPYLDVTDCQLLLVHHSMGHEFEQWLYDLDCPKVLMYHNITPEHYFLEDSPEHFFASIGREQLRAWPHRFVGAVGMSPYNSRELKQAGFSPVATLPLLVDPRRFDGASVAPVDSERRGEGLLLLSIGRLVENKRQHLLVDALWHLRQMNPELNATLCLVGESSSARYDAALRAHVQRLGLEPHVWFTGKCSDAQLRWLFEQADTLWCASEHEGFCMPLVEAGFYGVPVVAFDSSNIADTLGASGLLLEDANPSQMAAVTAMLHLDLDLHQQLVRSGTDNLQRFLPLTLQPQLQNFLLSLGLWVHEDAAS